MTKRKNRSYTNEFKQEAVALVLEQGYTVPKAAVVNNNWIVIHPNSLKVIH